MGAAPGVLDTARAHGRTGARAQTRLRTHQEFLVNNIINARPTAYVPLVRTRTRTHTHTPCARARTPNGPLHSRRAQCRCWP